MAQIVAQKEVLPWNLLARCCGKRDNLYYSYGKSRAKQVRQRERISKKLNSDRRQRTDDGRQPHQSPIQRFFHLLRRRWR